MSKGLIRGDKLLRFGSINSTNHEGLRAVASEVQKNENVSYSCVYWSAVYIDVF